MNVLILEDERNAAIRLQQLLLQAEPAAKVTGIVESVADALKWFAANEPPDLILSDIQLADGLSIDFIKELKGNIPVIFTTAFDAYTLSAFKLNSIDYLLKPVDIDELKAALAKYHALHAQRKPIDKQLADLLQAVTAGKPGYKSRFLIRLRDRLITIPIADVAYIRADDKVVFMHAADGGKHIIDEPLDELETVLDPVIFFRINRTYIASLASIESINNHFNGRLKISLTGSKDSDIFVSRARAGSFKEWLNK